MIQEALQEIKRGTAEIIDDARIETLIKAYYEKGTSYTVKAGFDPTAPDLHLGHTVLLHKLATFQKYGANVQFLSFRTHSASLRAGSERNLVFQSVSRFLPFGRNDKIGGAHSNAT